jgi:non-ribosomal peptide synthase protein (TIGR01720 family)
LQVYDWRGEADVDKLFREEVYKIQSSIDLSTGPLMKLGLFKRDDGDRLLWVIHHLVVDGVSWRILLEDVETLLLQFESGKPLQLPPKTDSFQRWAKGLVEYATSQALLREIEYWSEIARRVSVTLPLNGPVEINFSRDEESLVFHLSEAETADLMGPAHQSFGTEVNDLLLGALALAAGEVFGWSDVLFYLEGHGREEILDDINVNRTVGWFTSEFPLILSVPAEARSGGLSRFIRETKETLRRIPHKGIGYGILRYLTPSEYKAGMPEMSAEGISFNYLGQFDTGSTTSPRLLVSREGVGSEVGVDDIREHELTVIGSVAGKRLTMAIAFNRRHMDRSFIEALSAAYQLYLRQLMAFCLKQEKKVLSPSDLTYNELSIEDMDAIDSLFTNS